MAKGCHGSPSTLLQIGYLSIKYVGDDGLNDLGYSTWYQKFQVHWNAPGGNKRLRFWIRLHPLEILSIIILAKWHHIHDDLYNALMKLLSRTLKKYQLSGNYGQSSYLLVFLGQAHTQSMPCSPNKLESLTMHNITHHSLLV